MFHLQLEIARRKKPTEDSGGMHRLSVPAIGGNMYRYLEN